MEWTPFTFKRYRKAVVALAGLVIEIGALWQDAPQWVLVTVGVATWVVTVWVPNETTPAA